MPDVTKSTTIGGVRYEMRLLGGREARAVAIRVKPLILRALQEALRSLKLTPGKKLEDLEWSDLAGVVGAGAVLFEQLGDAEQEFLVQTFAQVTTVHLPSEAPGDLSRYPTPLSNRIDDLFVDKPYLLDEWLVWAVQQNGFFDLGPLAARLPAKAAPAPSASPTAATTSSGASC